jgi:hypothetical protein
MKRPSIEPGPNDAGAVYFIEAIGLALIKIGYSARPYTRFEHVRSHNADEVRLLGLIWVAHPEVAERAWHREFAGLRIRGEWFRADERLRSAIAERSAPLDSPEKPLKNP